MATPRVYSVIGWSLAVLALLAGAVAAVEAYMVGYPQPLSLITALLLAGAAISWPFVSAETSSNEVRACCVECGYPAWGFTEFHFCIHCGSTRIPQRLQA